MSLEEAQSELPGFPVAELPAYLRGPLVQLAKDEFVYDGSPFTLAGCIKENKPCKRHAMRGLTLIADQLAAGVPPSEALANYNRYYQSFEAKHRQAIDLSDSPCRGPADAPVTLVEFADYECPHCGAAAPVLEQVLQSDSRVRLCFKHFPLRTGSNAYAAAQAATYAHRHGKFWELHHRIFQNQMRLSPSLIRELVQSVGLDPQGLVRAVESGELSEVVDRQKEQGRALGITGTPTVFVNGRKHVLPLSPELLRFTIEDEVEWQAHGGKWADE